MVTGKNDDAARAREDSFLGELIPQVTEHLAAQHSGEFDTEAGRARFVTWLAAHTKEPVATAKGGMAWVRYLRSAIADDIWDYLGKRSAARNRVQLEKVRNDATQKLIPLLRPGMVLAEGGPDWHREIRVPEALPPTTHLTDVTPQPLPADELQPAPRSELEPPARNERDLARRQTRGPTENCTVCLSDVVAFSTRSRTDNDRRLIREALSKATQAALRDIPGAYIEDRGDGLLTVIPPDVPTARVMDQFLGTLPAALALHNSTQPESARFRLRLAFSVGPVSSDAMGVSGEAIIVAARLIEATHFKQAIERSTLGLGVIASPFVYEKVISHSRDPGYTEVPVDVKESRTTAWMKLVGASARAS